jgi:hypothetical protein
MLAILHVLEAKHAVECELCRTIDGAAGPPPTRRPNEDEVRPSVKTSPIRSLVLVSAIGLRWTDLDEAH